MNSSDDNHACDAEATGAPPSPGARLREKREARNLSLEGVARQLHLSVQAVRALEENDLAKLPPPVYVRGFLRSYARLVDIPEDEVLDALPTPVQPNVPKPSELFIAPPLAPSFRYGKLILMALILGVLVILAFLAVPYFEKLTSADLMADVSHLGSEPATPTVVPLPLEPAPLPVPTPPAPVSQPEPPPPPPSSPAVDAQPALVPSPPAAPPPETPSVPAVAAPPETAPLPPNALVLRFTGECWATVSDANGHRLLFEAGQPGEVKTVSGKPPLKVTLGRPANVNLEFNGRPFAHKYKDNGTPVRLRIGGDDGNRIP